MLNPSISRRRFLSRATRAALILSLHPGLSIASPAGDMETSPDIDKSQMTVLERDPQNLETPLERLTTWITPAEWFYVRTHNDTPTLDARSWHVRVDGLVHHPLSLTLADLKQFPVIEEIVTLECSGNGRAFYEPKIKGVQWRKGGVGTARWAGVRLADVLARAGIHSEGQHLHLNGADTDKHKPDFIRSLPIEKALDQATLLAFGMNGRVLPIPHGYPVRLIVPGWTGNHSMKWLTHIRVAREPFEGHFMDEYRFPATSIIPGTHLDPSDMEMITSLPVKSIITSPHDQNQIDRKPTKVTGVAYGGEGEIRGVDVSTDLGQHWEPAHLGPDKARFAWRLWEYEWQAPKAGAYVIMARAYDSLNRYQPIEPFWNPDGALWNVIDRIRVIVR
jgi:sulfite oxidase